MAKKESIVWLPSESRMNDDDDDEYTVLMVRDMFKSARWIQKSH